MKSRLLDETEGRRTYIVVLDTDDEAMASLETFAREHNLTAAHFTALGAFREGELYYFEWESKEYLSNPFYEQVEVASLVGDIALDREGHPALHAHVVLGKRDGTALAGHLSKGVVRPTLEVVIEETPAHLRRIKDGTTGLALIEPWIGGEESSGAYR